MEECGRIMGMEGHNLVKKASDLLSLKFSSLIY